MDKEYGAGLRKKLYQLIKPELVKLDIKLGRDAWFSHLSEIGMLVNPRKSYIKTNEQ